MRGKAKQRVSLILVVTMVLGTALTGNTVFATGESSDEQDRIKINISKDSEQTVEQNVAQTIHVTAQGQCSQSVCLNVYLKNEDGSAATDIDAVNLLTSDQLTDKNTQKTIDETLKDSGLLIMEQRQVQQQSGRTTRTIMEQLLLNICRSQCRQMQ